MLRSRVLGILVTFADEKIIAEARRRFDAHVAGSGSIPADLRKAVYRAMAMEAHKHPTLWDDLHKLAKASDLQEEIVRIYSSLGFARSKDLLLKVTVIRVLT